MSRESADAQTCADRGLERIHALLERFMMYLSVCFNSIFVDSTLTRLPENIIISCLHVVGLKELFRWARPIAQYATVSSWFRISRFCQERCRWKGLVGLAKVCMTVAAR